MQPNIQTNISISGFFGKMRTTVSKGTAEQTVGENVDKKKKIEVYEQNEYGNSDSDSGGEYSGTTESGTDQRGTSPERFFEITSNANGEMGQNEHREKSLFELMTVVRYYTIWK